MTKNKIRSAIIDLDGTLSDSSHRTHFVKQRPKNWTAFYNGLIDDPANEWCKVIVNSLPEDVIVMFVTGRGEEYKEPTLEWLSRHLKRDPNKCLLFMRKQGDKREDFMVKEEIYNKEIKPFYDVLFAIDDRQQVVDMWRRNNITCLQCDKGDF